MPISTSNHLPGIKNPIEARAPFAAEKVIVAVRRGG
jgi:hypothetical protein